MTPLFQTLALWQRAEVLTLDPVAYLLLGQIGHDPHLAKKNFLT